MTDLTTDLTTGLALDPRTTALLLMDLQVGILQRLADADAVLGAARTALDAARAAGAHVGHVRVALTDDDYAAAPPWSRFSAVGADPATRAAMHADSPLTAVHPEVAPVEGEVVVRKSRVGPFTTTDLREQLAARGVDTLVLGGVSTSGVVLSTVRQAADLDLRLVVVRDACADTDPEVHRVLVDKVLGRQATLVASDEVASLWG